MRIGVLRETAPGETRVALVPEDAARLVALGHSVVVEAGAGAAAFVPDAAYAGAGARSAADAAETVAASDLVLKVQPPAPVEAALLRRGQILVSLLFPSENEAAARALAERGAVAHALERVPRTTKAQSMDVLSSMSTVAGYKAALLAADTLGRMFPMLITAAGTIPPARVLVVGAGVAGLQAIATARRLGAQVEALDTRPAAREQVESLGARFVDLDVASGETKEGYATALDEEAQERQRRGLQALLRRFDAVIATALVPGRPAPRILTEAMVREMAPGSVVVDVAAPAGGNCELTRLGETVVAYGVTVLGPRNLPALLPAPSSRMFSRNVVAFVEHLLRGEEDDIVRETRFPGAVA